MELKNYNIRYFLMQGCYWALSGIIFGFTTVYLQEKQYTNYQIGIIFAMGNFFGFVAQPLIAVHIDKSRSTALLRYILSTATISLVLMLGVLFMPSACLPLSAAFVLLIGGNILLQPLCISLCFYLETFGSKINFSAARAVGSLSYGLATVVLGLLVERISAFAVPLSYIIITALFGALALSYTLGAKPREITKEAAIEVSEKPSGIFEFLKENKRFTFFLLGTSLLYFTHSLLGNFMIEFVRNVGGDSSDMGSILAFMTLSEIPVMLLFSKLSRRFSCSALLRFAVIMFTLKELMIYLAGSVAMFYAAEALQALSFAIFVPASVRYADEVIEKRNSTKGQTFITAVISMASIFASIIGGILLEGAGAKAALLVGVLVSAAGTFVMMFAIQKAK